MNTYKNMKHKKRNGVGIATFVLLLLMNSCSSDFLEVLPTGQLGQAQLTSKAGIEGALIAAYSQLTGRGAWHGASSHWLWGSIRGADSNKGTDPGDFSEMNPIMRYETLPTNGIVMELYREMYEGVSRANTTLSLLEQAGEDVSADDKVRIAAEAKFLRAHYYFQLARNFGKTPYIDETLQVGLGLEEVKNDQDLLPKVEADFTAAMNDLPETQSAVGRAHKTAAKAYLGKVKLYMGKHSEALALFTEVINSGVTSAGDKLELVPSFPDVFKAANDNHSESIFAVQSAANTGSTANAFPENAMNMPYNTGPDGPGNCCGFNQPSFESANIYRTDANGLPLADGQYNTAGNELVTDQGILSDQPFTPDAGNVDPRLDHTIGRRGIPFLDWMDHPGAAWIRNQPNAGPYTPKKFSYYKSDNEVFQDNSGWTPGYTAINFPIIRLADVLLYAAECEVEVGSLEKAREYVNMIRDRASNTVVEKNGNPAANYVIDIYQSAWTDQAAARYAVRMERRLEMNLEGSRFYDLVRWGTAAAELNRYIAYEETKIPGALTGASYQANQDELLPLPQSQIDILGDDILAQNPGY